MSQSISQLKKRLLFATALVLPQAALAQDDAGIASDEGNEVHGGDIIVTARKDEERLIEVPLQISVFSADSIEQEDIRDLTDIAQRTPGLEYESFPTSGLSSAPVIRGMSQTYTTSRIQNTAAFIDGIYLQRQSMVNPGLLEVERVEVVKGPQSAVYGRNAFAGSINYVTKKPSMDWEGSIGGTIGDHERYDYQGSISGPIVGDVLAVRLSYAHSEFDGHTKNHHPFADSAPAGKRATHGRLGGWDDETYSISALFKPADGVEISALYYKVKSFKEPQPFFNVNGARVSTYDESWGPADNQANCLNTTTINRVPTGPGTFVDIPIIGNHAYCGQLPTRPFADPVVDAAGFPSSQIMVDPRSHAADTESEIISANLAWDLTDRLHFKYQWGRVEHEASSFGVIAGRDSVLGALITDPLPPFLPRNQYRYSPFNANPIENLKSTSNEFRLTYDGDTIDLGVGVYLSETKDDDASVFYFPEPCDDAVTCSVALDQSDSAGPAALFIPTGPPPAPIITVPFFPFLGHGLLGNHDFFEDDVMAIFGSINWDISETFNLRVEARYEEEDKQYQQASTTFGRPANFAASEKAKFFTPRVTLQWQPEWLNGGQLYGLVAKGVKTGGFNSVDPNVNPQQATYDEETNWTYEIGGKGRFFNDRLALNLGLYYIDWNNIQGGEAAEASNPFQADVTGNIGDARVYGLEMDGVFYVADPFSIDFSFTALDPKYKSGVYASARTVNADGTPNPASTWGCTDLTPECDATGDISGNRLERTSTLQTSVGFNYNQEVKIISDWDMNARIGFNYRNKMYATPLNLAHNGDRLLTNANLSFSNDNFSVSFWGKNIFNKRYVANSFILQSFNSYIVGLGAERTFGVTVKAGF